VTEAELAARLARDLGPLATDAGWSATATAGQSEGHYSDAIADAKDDLGFAGDLGDATLTPAQLAELRDRALLVCLERLERYYITLVDTSSGTGEGSQAQKLSQVQKALVLVRTNLDRKMSVSRGVKLRGRRRPDYTLGEGDEVEE